MIQNQDKQTVFDFMMRAENSPAIRPEVAVAVLDRSPSGHDAITHLYSFLTGPGMRLDGEDQTRFLALLITAWSSRPGLVLGVLAERINTPPSSESQPMQD